MQSHKFAVIKLYIPEACSSKFCKAKITIHKLTLCKRNRKQIHFGKITVIKAAKFIITFWQRSFFKVDFIEGFIEFVNRHWPEILRSHKLAKLPKKSATCTGCTSRSKHLIFWFNKIKRFADVQTLIFSKFIFSNTIMSMNNFTFLFSTS